MDDLKQFNHAEEGTHSCCQRRLDKEGGKAQCCYCVPHEGCEADNSGDNVKKECIDCEDGEYGEPCIKHV